MLDFNKDVRPYLQLGSDNRPAANLRHAFYQASIDHRDRLREVFGKAYPTYLDIARPKERKEYKEYRRLIYKNPLRSMRRRVVEVLDYVRQADDFDVVFGKDAASKTDSFASFVSDARYTTDGNALNWFWKNIRKKYVGDPNAVLVVLPLSQPVSDTERMQPTPMLIDCENVYQHRKGEYAVLESTEKTWIEGPKGPEKTGKILLFLDHESYCIARQTARTVTGTDALLMWDILGVGNELAEDQVVTTFNPPLHNCPVMPARKIGKLQEEQAEENAKGKKLLTPVQSTDQGEEYYESILSDSLPHVESAQGINSDIEVERNFHVSSQEWRYAQKRCPDSNMAGGACMDGKVITRNLEGEVTGSRICTTCQGTGMDVSGSGLGYIIVSAPQATNAMDEGRPTNLPTPPGGFIPRSIDPLIEFVKEFEREKKQAYETINMQFLMETPYDQSGTSKKYDREELYRQLITEGAHLCALLSFYYECAAYLRRQEKEIPAVLPPVRLSIENAELTREELSTAVDKNFDSNLRKPLEKKLIAYQSGEDSDYFRRYELREKIDPYAGDEQEEKMFLAANMRVLLPAGSVELQAVLERILFSVHFDGLVSDELRTNKDFWNLTPDVQEEKLRERAKKLIGKIQGPMIDDQGKEIPAGAGATLQPMVDLKNANQLRG